MINKIIGLVLITPFLAMLLAFDYCKRQKKRESNTNNMWLKATLIGWFYMSIAEAFFIGLYFLFK